MLVGVPKEIKDNEFRAGMVPSSVQEVVSHGHDVMVQSGLGLEVDVLGHPGQLDAALQLGLAPFASRLRLAQGFDQGAGLRAEVAEPDFHLVEQRADGAVGGFALAAHRRDLAFDPFEVLADRFGQATEFGLAFRQRRIRRRRVHFA